MRMTHWKKADFDLIKRTRFDPEGQHRKYLYHISMLVVDVMIINKEEQKNKNISILVYFDSHDQNCRIVDIVYEATVQSYLQPSSVIAKHIRLSDLDHNINYPSDYR